MNNKIYTGYAARHSKGSNPLNKKYQKWYTIDALGAIFAIFKYAHFDHFE